MIKMKKNLTNDKNSHAQEKFNLAKNSDGFTLIELVVVVLILGIIAVVVVPNILDQVQKSRETSDIVTASSIAEATMMAIVNDSLGANTYTVSTTASISKYLQSLPKSQSDPDAEFEVTVGANNAITVQLKSTGATKVLYPEPTPTT